MSEARHVVFELGDWRVNSLDHTLTNDSSEIQVPAKVMAVLVHLAHNQDRLVTRQELIDVVWDGNAYVGENSLNNAIWRIRQVLSEDSENAEFIRTTPKKGYQLVPKPTFVGASEVTQSTPTRSGRTMWIGFGLAIVTLVSAVAATVFLRPAVAPKVATEEPLAVVTQMPGRELYATPSLDRTAFAFLHVSPEGTVDIYVQSLLNLDELPVRISSLDADNYSPTWAPDSKHLAYLRIDSESAPCEIVVWSAETGQNDIIGDCVDFDYPTLSWSPDGQWLVYRNSDAEAGPGLYLKSMNSQFRPAGEFADRRISCDDCKLFDQEVSWSPDSQYLAVSRSENRMSENVYKFDLNTFQFDRLTSGEISIKGHTWSEDGKQVLYVSNKHPANRRLWSVNVDTKAKQEHGYNGAGFPAYLSDYESILFYQRRVTTFIASISIQQSDETLLFPQPVIQTSGAERNPEYSSAANKLTYYSNLSGHNEIWIADPNGSNRNQITDLKSNSIDPSWSPDGQRIAFVALHPKTESTELNIYDFASRSIQTLVNGFGAFGPPSWARDGQSLIVPIWKGADVDLWRIAIDGHQLTRLTTTGAKFGRESSDGTSLVFTKKDSKGLFRLSIEGGAEEQLIRDIVSHGYGNWTWAGDSAIIYARHRGGRSEIVRYDLLTEVQSVLVKHPGRTVHRSGMLSYSDYHKVLYFTHREPQQIDIMMAPDPLSKP